MPQLLKSGKNNKKLGIKINKKKWKNLPIYSLTLEERNTCPSHCEQWDNCYGDNMPFAHRFDHTHPEFLQNLTMNLMRLFRLHPNGIVIRLHVLGDFFSKEYVKYWESCLKIFNGLHIMGFTHHRQHDELGILIKKLNKNPRCVIRFSDDQSTLLSAHVISDSSEITNYSNAIICPEQLLKTQNCGTCALCWTSDKTILFIKH